MNISKFDLKEVFTKGVLNRFLGQGYGKSLGNMNLSRVFTRMAALGGRTNAIIHKCFDGFLGPHNH